MTTARKLSAHDERRLAVHIRRDPRSVRNAYELRAKPIVMLSVREAAIELGLPPPPEPQEPPAAAE